MHRAVTASGASATRFPHHITTMSIKERRDITALASHGGAGVLVTLVRVAGSSYRRPGARLLALHDGRTAGTISGGCLEADLLRQAHWRVRNGAILHRYDTGFDEMAEVPFGLGCGGLVDLLLERTDTPEGQAVIDALAATLAGEARHLVTRFPGERTPLQRLVLDRAGDVLFCSETLATEDVVSLRALALGRVPASTAAHNLFLEHLKPAQRLVIFGAGEDARPLARVAAELGWTIIVADGRPQHAKAERFPQAHAVLLAESAAQAGVTAQDAVVLMTHSFEQDGRLLGELLAIKPCYLGLLGARQRSALLLDRASATANISLRDAIAATHAPIGLELGGDGPESIALAITAEIQAVLRNAGGMPRRMTVDDAELLLQRFAALPHPVPVCALETAATLPHPAFGQELQS